MRSFLVLFFFLSFSILLPCTAAAMDIPEDQESFDAFMKMAENGDPEACFLAGRLFVKTDQPEKAKAFLEAGARNGGLDCVTALGQAEEKGMFGPINLAKALEHYQTAAAKNHGIAMLKLGNMYRDGNGVAQDYKLAGQWTMKAAKSGVREACTNLGLHYMMGWGVKKNLVKAFALYCIGGETDEVAKSQAFLIYEKLSDEEKMQSEVIMMEWEKIFPPPDKEK